MAIISQSEIQEIVDNLNVVIEKLNRLSIGKDDGAVESTVSEVASTEDIASEAESAGGVSPIVHKKSERS